MSNQRDSKKNRMNDDSRERMERKEKQQQQQQQEWASCRLFLGYMTTMTTTLIAAVVVVVVCCCLLLAAAIWTRGDSDVFDSSLNTVLFLPQRSSSFTTTTTKTTSIVDTLYKRPNITSTSFPLHQPQKQERRRRRRLSETKESSLQEEDGKHADGSPIRILYIITTLAEYNSGKRSTIQGSDRLQETLIPVMTESVESMINAGYHVDIFLVCHFIMRPERLTLIHQALPKSVGLEYWDNATPLGYDTGDKHFTKLKNKTEHLARQHRFVIKDKLSLYDQFVCFEDDMVIKAIHVSHYRKMTHEIMRLRNEAPDELTTDEQEQNNANPITKNFHGIMTKAMLQRIIPGFIRVEVLLNEEQYGAQKDPGPIPIDLNFDIDNNNGQQQQQVNPEYCCHVQTKTANEHIPENPKPDKLMLWETNILPLGIRQMPTPTSSSNKWLDWVVLLRGPTQTKLSKNATIGDYWSNRHGDYYKDMKSDKHRPAPIAFKYINNQGGWMATREQLWEWHVDICPGGFLPPYEAPHYRFDGLDMRNVEWYSGGMQLSTVRHACNMQRIIMMDPENFSKSLIYHSANNKQRQLAQEGKREWFVKANTLLGQLNTIKKRALQDMMQEEEVEKERQQRI